MAGKRELMTPIPDNYNVPKPSKQEFDLLPADVYEVEITKVELRTDVPVYQTNDVEDKFNFEFTVLDDGSFKGRKLWREVRTVMSAGFQGGSPSLLYKIFCAVNGVTLGDDEAQSVTASNINEMEGKPLKVVVKEHISGTGKHSNKITDFLPIAKAKVMPSFAKPQPTGETISRPASPSDYVATPEGDDVNVEGIPF